MNRNRATHHIVLAVLGMLALAGAANTLPTAFPGSYTPTAIRLHHPTKQDMLIVPEPASAVLLSWGAFGVLRSYRRKRFRVPSHVD